MRSTHQELSAIAKVSRPQLDPFDADCRPDPFDADYCPTEARAAPLDQWSPSFLPASTPVLPVLDVDACRRRIADALAMCRPRKPKAGDPARESYKHMTCWRDTPELYRKEIARTAGLTPAVVKKLDRDLTETEKAMLRAAATALRDCCNSLVHL